MNLLEEFNKNLLKIAILKNLSIKNQLIMKLLNLEHFKRQTFASYLLKSKQEIKYLINLHSEKIEDLKKEYLSHRDISLILKSIDSIFYTSSIEQSVKIDSDKNEEEIIVEDSKEKAIDNDLKEDHEPLSTSAFNDLIKSKNSDSFLKDLRKRKRNTWFILIYKIGA